ncbi:hypothetical protein ACXYMO_12505 [Arenibacterium sp. CAU 1754]
MSDDSDVLYPGGLYAMVKRFESKRRALNGAADILPPADTDLEALWDRIVPVPEMPFGDAPKNSALRKRLELQIEFQGQSEILLLHAQLISILRREAPPDQALPLFLRIWAEQGDRIADMLTARWLISAATTFADCGITAEQRACGTGMAVMFDMIKLHDTERRLSGHPGSDPFLRRRKARRHALPFGLNGYSFRNGDLDLNLFARMWKLCESDLTIRPLGLRMLDLALSDKSTVFARIQEIRRLNREIEDER